MAGLARVKVWAYCVREIGDYPWFLEGDTMTDKPEEPQLRQCSPMVRRVAEQLARQEMSCDLRRKLSQLTTGKQDWLQSIMARVAELKPTISSIGELAAERSGSIEKEKQLLDRIETLSRELNETRKRKDEKERLSAELQQALVEYQKQEKIKYLRGKLAKDAEQCIRTKPDFLAQFAPGVSHRAYVTAIDIRSSTELMLNAKTPDEFAQFITELCDKLTALVIENGGIFDKFTGDGVLAFFPDFYSGQDSGYRAILTASKAISFFQEHYKKHRRCFRVVTTQTGLGVGIDLGTVHFVNIGESLSVVGTPVVYACRLSSAPAGAIYLNQPAQEEIRSRYDAQTVIHETTLQIKGSGEIVAYNVELKGAAITPADLPWRERATESTAAPR